ncbi:VCBS repeat-containing protein [Aquimarina sediminis]|uniref:VCBS repeat-containing protein n=1 Tax=Aquimarina sediminis TaxID=2070536 RepID=UPI000CA08DC0|nr:VCBS repeat-containing protein [Aquimarina sediminis]
MKITNPYLYCIPVVILVLFFFNKNEEEIDTVVQKRFSILDSSYSGVTFSNTIKDTKERNILKYANFYGGAGVGVGDFNNDGLQDIYFAGNIVPDKVYFNQGKLVFKDVTKEVGIKNDGGWSTGVTVADVNNDGYVDVYVSRELYDDKPDWRSNLLYINKGDGTFIESAAEYGVADSQRTRHATFFDYDKDGFLDLFLLTQPPNPGSYSDYFGTKLLQPEYHVKLFRNTGKESFVEVTKQAGLLHTGFPNAVSASDINNDGWTDLYVANDFYAPDFVFINNKDGTFINQADSALNHMSYYSMGVDIADINNDGLLDVFVVDMVAEDNFRSKSNMSGMNPKAFQRVVDNGGHYQYMYNTVQLNNGNSTFSDIAQLTNMAATDWSWSNLIADFDNDGLKDVYITNGLLRDIRNTDADKKVGEYVIETANNWISKNPHAGEISIWEILDLDKTLALLPSQPLQNYAYKNYGNLKFKKAMNEWGLDQKSFSNGAAYADFDNDGDLDIVVNNINEEAFIYRNNSEILSKSNFLRIKLSDKKGRPVFGTRVQLYCKDGVQTQETTNVRGIYSTSEPLVHFGLGNLKKVDSLIITWPNGTQLVKKDIAANKLLQLEMVSGSALADNRKPDVVTKDLLFKEITTSFGINYKHIENVFDDYKKQVLLPHKLSQFGPALAIGDINNDELEDVFIGGATGFDAVLYIQNNEGSFSKSNKALWVKENAYEDVDAIFVDINGDSYLDLYVVSGGNEYPINDPHYIDRLYLNDGKGNFSKGAILNVNRQSGSKAIVEDYDNDGDYDVFVGGRVVPHQYPMPASSMLLKNENGQLVNVTDMIAPEFKDIGMVTDAVWTDYDNDADIDLILVGEWMPITLFKNEQGKLYKETNESLEKSAGWWFSLEKGDFDNDGDIDFIAGNIGLNYKYKTSEETPFDVYYHDFDSNGSQDIVLGYYDKNKHYPVRGFSCSAEQIPLLKKQINNYDLFASLEINQVYGEKKLGNALHYKAETFASSYIENKGNGVFKISPLPYQAQLSSINDIVVNDFNNDGNQDALMAGNLFVSEIETPRNDAGIGLLMLGDGKGNFSPTLGKESGFFANKDAKKIKILNSKKGKKVLVANNDSELQSFILKK